MQDSRYLNEPCSSNRFLKLADKPQAEESFIGTPNDDKRERQKRRQSRILETAEQLEENNASQPQDAPHLRMTTGDMSAHYGDCIKLATENKITPKNAFSLHLIDFIPIMMRQNQIDSFQMASSSLDAGAKIYASRVDAVHKEAYHVVSSLGRTSEQPREISENEDDEEPGDGERPQGEDGSPEDAEGGPSEAVANNKKKGKKQSGRRNAVLVTNVAKLRIKPVQLHSEMDPLFQQQAQVYDEGGTKSLRLNNVSTFGATSELLLDSNTIVPILKDLEEAPQDAEHVQLERERHAVWYDREGISKDASFQTVNRIMKLLMRGRTSFQSPGSSSNASVQVCAEFSRFHIGGWEPQDRMPDIFPALSQATSMFPAGSGIAGLTPNDHLLTGGRPSLDDQPEIFIPTIDVDSPIILPDTPFSDSDSVVHEVLDPPDHVSVDRESLLEETVTHNEDAQSFLERFRAICTTTQEGFSRVEEDMFGMWAGPSHWRQKYRDPKTVLTLKSAASQNILDGEVAPVPPPAKGGKSKKAKMGFMELVAKPCEMPPPPVPPPRGRKRKSKVENVPVVVTQLHPDFESKTDYMLSVLKMSRAATVLSPEVWVQHSQVSKRLAPRLAMEPMMDKGDHMMHRQLDLFSVLTSKHVSSADGLVEEGEPHGNPDMAQILNLEPLQEEHGAPDVMNLEVGDTSSAGDEVPHLDDVEVQFNMAHEEDFDVNFGAPEVAAGEGFIVNKEEDALPETPIQVVDCFSSQQTQPFETESGNLQLMAPPRKIQKIDIAYARAAKRVNVKRLKMVMWMVLEPLPVEFMRDPSERVSVLPAVEPQSSSLVPCSSSSSSTPTIGQDSMLFSQLVQRIPNQFSTTMAQDLSGPLVFTCLLYLANEKTLAISNVPGFTDLSIRRGSTDVRQVANPLTDPNLAKIQAYAAQYMLQRDRGNSSRMPSSSAKKRKKNDPVEGGKKMRQSRLTEFGMVPVHVDDLDDSQDEEDSDSESPSSSSLW